MTMHTLLTRWSLQQEGEEIAAKDHFHCVPSRMSIPRDSVVIGRYSVLPYYDELEQDLKTIDSRLINSFDQHRLMADIERWYPVVREFTPETWFTRWDLLPDNTSFVVKGKTNSRKSQWNTHMFARDKTQLREVLDRLYDDPLLSDQGLVVRRYVPLKQLGVGLNGLPFSNEWRFFFLGETLVDCGFYWSLMGGSPKDLPEEAMSFARKLAKLVAVHTNFFVLDIAETSDGNWTLIEINDAQMSGLCDIPPDRFYQNLASSLP